MTEHAEHEHAWRPMQGWSGRYACEECHALGYRKLVIGITENSRENERIIPYACARSGCARHATHRTHGQLCTEHERERVAKEAAKDAEAKAKRLKAREKAKAAGREDA